MTSIRFIIVLRNNEASDIVITTVTVVIIDEWRRWWWTCIAHTWIQMTGSSRSSFAPNVSSTNQAKSSAEIESYLSLSVRQTLIVLIQAYFVCDVVNSRSIAGV